MAHSWGRLNNVDGIVEFLGNGLYYRLWGDEAVVKQHNEDLVELRKTIKGLEGKVRWYERVLDDEPWLQAGFTREVQDDRSLT